MDATAGTHGRGAHARGPDGRLNEPPACLPVAAHPRRLRTAAGVAGMALTALLLGGCLSIEHDTRYRSLAATDSEEMFNQIVPGRTTRAWLTERLGSPDALWRDAAEHDVLRYDNVREHRTSVSLFPLIDVDVNNEDVERYFFEFADGMLVRYWRATGEGVELLQPPAPAAAAAELPPAATFAATSQPTAPAPPAAVAESPAAHAHAHASATPAHATGSAAAAGHAPATQAPPAPAAQRSTAPAGTRHAPPAPAPSAHAPSARAPAAQGQLDRGPIERTL